MDDDLPPFFDTADQPVGIGVPTGEQDLKEQHQRGPDSGRATKPGQDEFADHRLNLEEEERGEKNADGKEEHGE